MEYLTYYTAKLGFGQLHAQHSLFANSHYFDASGGKKDDSFGFILKGRVTYRSIGKNLEIPEGSLFYIPNGMRYNSVWSGEPEIEFYSVHKVQRQWGIDESDAFALQRIPEMSTDGTARCFRQIHDLLASGEECDRFRAFALFFDFYAEALPYLKRERAPVHGSALRAAVEYIEKNYATDFSIADLAQACHISEAWLYHLFQRELQSSPVQLRNEYRVEKAAQDLRDTALPIDEVAFINGFHSTAYFREVFRARTGMTPMDYRKTLEKMKTH